MGLQPGITAVLFAIEEDVNGTMKVPTGNDVVRLTADADFGQEKNMGFSREMVDSFSRTGYLSRRYGQGDGSWEMYLKRTGNVDTVVQGCDTCLKNAFGRKFADTGVSVNYLLAQRSTAEKTLSLFYRIADLTLQMRGFAINEFTMPFDASLNESSDLAGRFGGNFMEMFWAGRANITEALTTSDAGLTKFKVALTDVGKFKVGAFVKAAALSTSHEIIDIDNLTGLVTVDPAFGSNQLTGTGIEGFIPTPVDTGSVLNGFQGTYAMNPGSGAVNLTLLGGELRLVNNKRIVTEEMNNSPYGSNFVREDWRTVTLEGVRAYLDYEKTPPPDSFFNLADNMTNVAVTLTIGPSAGLRYIAMLPITKLQNPRVRSGGIVEIEWMQAAIASSAFDDELVLKAA